MLVSPQKPAQNRPNILAAVALNPALDAVIYDQAHPLPAHYEALLQAVLPNRCQTEARVPDLERAQRSANRTNAKRVGKFAGTLFFDDPEVIGPLRTAEQVVDMVAEKFAHLEAGSRRLFVAGTYYRSIFRRLRGDEETLVNQARFMRVLPHDAAYWADFWWQRLKEVDPAVLDTIDRHALPVLPECEVDFG